MSHAWTPQRFRITVEYETYEQAQLAGSILRSTAPRLFVYDALNGDGEPLWHERGELHFRPVYDK